MLDIITFTEISRIVFWILSYFVLYYYRENFILWKIKRLDFIPLRFFLSFQNLQVFSPQKIS